MVGSNSWAVTCRPQAAQSGSARTTAESTDASSYRRRLEEPMHAIMRQQRNRLQVGLLRCGVLRGRRNKPRRKFREVVGASARYD